MVDTLRGRSDSELSPGRSPEPRTSVWHKTARHDCQTLSPVLKGYTLTRVADGDGSLDRFIRDRARQVASLDYTSDAFYTALADRGVVTTEAVLDILAMIARQLGEMWLEDDCSFNDVTIGMHRLTMLLIAIEPYGTDPEATERHGGRVFLAPAPGDQHGFGLAMIGYFLRRSGWDVAAELDAHEDRIVDHIASRHYDCVGFSIGHERAVETVGALIEKIRARSRNDHLKIMVGGPIISADPTVADQMGADLWAADGASLVERLIPFIPAT